MDNIMLREPALRTRAGCTEAGKRACRMTGNSQNSSVPTTNQNSDAVRDVPR